MIDVPKFVPIKNLTVAKMLQSHGKATATALVKLTGKPMKSVLSTLKTLHNRSKIHIGDYEINKRGQVSRVWQWGDGDDKREPLIVKNKQPFTPRPDMASAWLRNPI
jgi:hypothetical protein